MAKGVQLKNLVLTTRAIESFKPAAQAYRVADVRCPGLGIRVAVSGAKSWDAVFRIRGTGTIRRKSLGLFPAVTLEAARSRAAKLAAAAQGGRDLIAEEAHEREKQAARISLKDLIEEYLRRACQKLRTRREIGLRLHRAMADYVDKCAEDVQRRDLRRLLDAVADRGTPREAEKQRQSIGAMYNWAVSQDIVSHNPISGLKTYSGGNTRDRVLSAEELKVFWDWLSLGHLTANMADALRLQICLGARIGETAGIYAEEVDQARWLWTLPASRSKNKKPRVTPLIGMAQMILKDRLRYIERGPLFINETGAALRSNDIGSAIVTRRKRIPIAHFVSHDLRRTVATQLIEMGIAYDTVAGVLGHDAGTRTTRTLIKHYVRTDLIPQKVHALEVWNRHLMEIVKGSAESSNVIRLSSTMASGS